MLTNISPKKTTDRSRVCKPICMNTPRDKRDWSWLPSSITGAETKKI